MKNNIYLDLIQYFIKNIYTIITTRGGNDHNLTIWIFKYISRHEDLVGFSKESRGKVCSNVWPNTLKSKM